MTTQQATSTLLPASELQGTKVKNFQDQDIGDVDELLIRPDTGEVRFAVLSVGGFLGLGTTRVAVPWGAFNITAQRDGKITIRLDATKERLEKAPRISGKNYDRLYMDEEAEPVFVYWEVDYID
jgi:sporulation protein YlmC with PRC-barrel domain